MSSARRGIADTRGCGLVRLSGHLSAKGRVKPARGDARVVSHDDVDRGFSQKHPAGPFWGPLRLILPKSTLDLFGWGPMRPLIPVFSGASAQSSLSRFLWIRPPGCGNCAQPPAPTPDDCEDLAYQVAERLLEVQREKRRRFWGQLGDQFPVTQSSSRRPGTRENSRRLFVTRVASRLRT